MSYHTRGWSVFLVVLLLLLRNKFTWQPGTQCCTVPLGRRGMPAWKWSAPQPEASGVVGAVELCVEWQWLFVWWQSSEGDGMFADHWPNGNAARSASVHPILSLPSCRLTRPLWGLCPPVSHAVPPRGVDLRPTSSSSSSYFNVVWYQPRPVTTLICIQANYKHWNDHITAHVNDEWVIMEGKIVVDNGAGMINMEFKPSVNFEAL